MKLYVYIVTFDTYRNNMDYNQVYHCIAQNAKEACQIAKDAWLQQGRKSHPFHVHAVKARTQDVDLLKVRTWKNTEIAGQILIGSFCCVDFRSIKRRA